MNESDDSLINHLAIILIMWRALPDPLRTELHVTRNDEI